MTECDSGEVDPWSKGEVKARVGYAVVRGYNSE